MRRRLNSFCSILVRTNYACHVVAISYVLSRIIKFTLTVCTTQSLYHPQTIHITAVKITVAIICRWVFFSSSIVRVIVAFVGRTRKRTNK